MAIQLEGSNRIQPYTSSQSYIQSNSGGDYVKQQADSQMQNLQKGEVVEGKVLQTKENSVSLEVNGKVIEAKLDGRFEFVEGEIVRLTVLDANAEKILLKSNVDSNVLSEKRLEDILTQLSIKVTEENKFLVQELMAAKLPLSPELLKNLQSVMQKYPQINVKTLIFLHRNGIELNDANLNELIKTQNSPDLLSSRLDEVIGKLAKMIQSEKGSMFFGKLVSGNPQGEALLEHIKYMLSGQQEEKPTTPSPLLSKVFSPTEMETMVKEIETLLQSEYPNFFDKEVIVDNLLQKILQFQTKGELTPDNPKFNQEIFQQLKGSILKGAFLDEILSKLGEFPKEVQDSIKQVIAEKLAGNALRKELLLSGKEEDAAEHLEKLFDKLTQLKDSSDGSMLAKNIMRDVLSARDSMNFMNKFDSNSGFLQLPFLMGDKVLNGELFVLKDKKAKGQKLNDNISALLQLDFATLGHLDTFIKKEGMKLQIDFYAEDAEKEKWIREKIHLLHNSLMDKNYQIMAINTFVKREKTDGFADFLADERIQKVSRFSFDMRA